MTKTKIEKIGFIADRKPNTYFLPMIEEVFLIPNSYSYEDILQLIYNSGIDCGIKIGKQEKIQEIKSVLNID